MNQDLIQAEVIKKLKNTRSHFTKIIKMVEKGVEVQDIRMEILRLQNKLHEVVNLSQVPEIFSKINEGDIEQAIKVIAKI